LGLWCGAFDTWKRKKRMYSGEGWAGLAGCFFFAPIILSNLNGFIFSKAEVQWFIWALISYSPCSKLCSGFSRYIVFAMHLYIGYVSRKAKTTYNLEWRE
jgi:hypothetical protein